MQASECFSNILIPKNTINFSSFIFLRPIFERWVNEFAHERRHSYLRAYEFINCLARIPEIRIINNLILPNCIIGVYKDVDYLLPIFTQTASLWKIYDSFNIIDFRGASIYQHKYLYGLKLIILELVQHCKWVMVSVPQFMTTTEFWDWLLNSTEFNDSTRAQIIFFTAKQARTYKTTAAGGSIPLDIAYLQNQFYSEEYGPRNINYSIDILEPKIQTNPHSLISIQTCPSMRPVNNKFTQDTPPFMNGSEGNLLEKTQQPLIIAALDKLRLELIKYNTEFPEVLQIETGGLIEKINDIRAILGIHDT